MNIVFWIIVFAIVVVIWFALRDSFEGIGKKFYRNYDDVADIVEKEEEPYEEYDSEYAKEEFIKYMEKGEMK